MDFPLVLGLDASTQSLTAVVVDRRDPLSLITKSISFANDLRLSWIAFDRTSMLLPVRESGEADQPPALFLAALELILSDLADLGVDLALVGLINVSAQQHGHVYLSDGVARAFKALQTGTSLDVSLAQLFETAWSYPRAPIWKTSNTTSEAEDLRRSVGGSSAMVRLTGSDSPLRFTGAVARRVFATQPGVWDQTIRVHLLSSFLPAVLTANLDVAIDWGNASGTSWMNFETRTWDNRLFGATSEGLAGGLARLKSVVPALAHPLTLAGTVAPWFTEHFGLPREARVLIGSGDNPQTKVLYSGDLLSLGTSFVLMAGSGRVTIDERGWGNAMYDGVGQPFLFGCRTNGALVWDQARRSAGWPAKDFQTSEKALEHTPLGSVLVIWQPDVESFPPSPPVPMAHRGTTPTPSEQYAGLVDSGLGLLYLASRPWLEGATEPLGVTGGAVSSPAILARVAAFWNRPVVTLGTTGAALGAAAAALAYDGESISLLPPSRPIYPKPEDVALLHGAGGYLSNLESFWQEIMQQKGDLR